MKIRSCGLSFALGCAALPLFSGIPHLNLFTPYDWLLRPPERPNACWQITFDYEGAFKSHGYQAAEDDNGYSDCFRKRADFLQLWQDSQDLLAALKGEDYISDYGRLSQKFNIQDDDGTYDLLTPCADLSVHNCMFSSRWYLPHDVTLSAHLPVISMRMHNVRWVPAANNTNQTFDSQVVDDLVHEIEEIGDINLYNWSRAGVGDLTMLTWWGRSFQQARPLLTMVYLGVRGGLSFPTGKHTDEDVMLGFPFGNDAGLGFLIGGHMQLWFGSYVRAGVDVELHHLFGDTRERRIKTDLAQTDLVFLQKVKTFKEPGFMQHYTLYLEGAWDQVSGQLAYQYTRQQEDKLFLGTDHFDPVIANTAEKLQDWTAHSLIFSVNYDFFDSCTQECPQWRPYVSLFVKYGFNGKRSVLLDTVTVALSADF